MKKNCKLNYNDFVHPFYKNSLLFDINTAKNPLFETFSNRNTKAP